MSKEINRLELLNDLLDNMGQAETVAYIRLALPRVIERRDALLDLLQRQEWDAAAAFAHKVISSSGFYASPELVGLLLRLEQKAIGEMTCEAFQQQLTREFNSAIRHTEEWLAMHSH